MAFSYESIELTIDGLSRCLSWYAQIGIPVGRTRLEWLAARLRQALAETQELTEIKRREVWAANGTYYLLADAMAFGKVATALSRLPSHCLPRKKLGEVLGGPGHQAHEEPYTTSSHARNTLAELELAADLLLKGLAVTGFDDVQFSFEGTHFVVEVKRPWSERAVARAVATGFGQVTRRLNVTSGLGFVCIASERAIGIDRRVLEVASDSEVGEQAEALAREFFARHRVALSAPVDTRVVGLILLLRFVVIARHRGVVGPAMNIVFKPFVSPALLQGAEHSQIERLVAAMERGAVPRHP